MIHMKDIRDDIFKKHSESLVTACLYTDEDGVISGTAEALKKAKELGLHADHALPEGSEVLAGDLIMQVSGTPKAICMAEDILIGCLSKYSGVATAARAFSEKAGADLRVVCGAWKKMPHAIKEPLRAAIETGGVSVRISNEPMIYLDKNYVEILGGIQKALIAVSALEGRKKAIQVKGRHEGGDIVREAWTAITSGADIVYVDTGNVDDLRRVTDALVPQLQGLQGSSDYRKIEFAFGGGVSLDDLDAVRAAGADIVGVGRAIIDAPLLDMRLEVTNVTASDGAHAGYDLLDKHELLIQGIELRSTDLNELAAIVADEIGIDPEDVLVIDVRDQTVALDILRSNLDPARFIARESAILRHISELAGVHLLPNAHITSNGMLGWIAGDEADITEGQNMIAQSRELAVQITSAVSRRVIVFPTGAEVERGEIKDTNTPLIMQKFSEAGFFVEKGDILKDDINLFCGKLMRAAEEAYGVVITTGGVGAENKDFSVEAIELLDPAACTPYIAKFQAGHGRHSKDGIRIGVGKSGLTTYIALPGPNDEVALCVDTVVQGISEGWSKEILAGKIAEKLRARLKQKIGVSMHHPQDARDIKV